MSNITLNVSTGDSLLYKSSTSKGNQEKWVVTYAGSRLYVKADRHGYESIAEVVAGLFLECVEDADFVRYFLCTVDTGNSKQYGCYSHDMLAEGESLFSVYNLLKKKYRDIDSLLIGLKGKSLYDFVVKEVKNLTGVDIRSYLRFLLLVDAVLLNEDRHLENIALIHSSDGSFRVSPIFDNGLSLLADAKLYRMTVDYTKLIHTVNAKPFDKDFINQLSYCQGDNILKVRYKALIDKLNAFDLGYKSEGRIKSFYRAGDVLMYRLKELEGVVWEKKRI